VLWLVWIVALGAAVGTALADVGTVRVAEGLSRPVFVTAPPGDPRLFIVEQGGLIRVMRDREILPMPFLDLTDEIEGIISGYDERGLLGLAFSADYETSGLLYVDYTTLMNDRTVVARYRVSGNPDVADESTEEILLVIPQPSWNHNGGHLAFGPDGMLYIGTGDGGFAFDPQNHAQRDDTLLGNMLRFDVSDFGTGDPLDGIWAKGLRNPYRFSFDRLTGDLYIADVGQSAVEEVDVQPASSTGGENYGWSILEGSLCLEPDACDSPDLTPPVLGYTHGGTPFRCSITGGYVYRGAIREIKGHYFFADYCSAQTWSLVWDEAAGVVDVRERTAELAPDTGRIDAISGFGEDGLGELLVVDHDDGELFLVVDTSPDTDGDGVRDGSDVCPFVPDPDQSDTDTNGIGDACQCGDVNRDGVTNVTDALAIARGEVVSSDPGFGRCDVNGDDACNVADALGIARGEVDLSFDEQLCAAWLGE
jgi:hypothetical protein